MDVTRRGAHADLRSDGSLIQLHRELNVLRLPYRHQVAGSLVDHPLHLAFLHIQNAQRFTQLTQVADVRGQDNHLSLRRKDAGKLCRITRCEDNHDGVNTFRKDR